MVSFVELLGIQNDDKLNFNLHISNICRSFANQLSTLSVKKVENLQKMALRFPYNDYEISFEDLLLKSGRSTMIANRLRILCIEIYKTINNLKLEFMRDLLCLRETSRLIREKYLSNLSIPVHN